MHFGRKAAHIIAPDSPRSAPEKSALVSVTFNVHGLLEFQEPLNVKDANDLLAYWRVGVLMCTITNQDK